MDLDEAPTSSTSVKAGTLHTPQDPKQVLERRYHRRTSSFPTSLSFRTSVSLNFFRKNKDRSAKVPTKASNKTDPEPNNTAPDAGEIEPYEVAPGIWSNEATAQVFGYLDNPSSPTRGKEHRRKKRSESARPSLYHRKNRSPSPVEGLVQSNNVTRPEYDRLASSSWRTYGRRTEESAKIGRGRTDGVAGKVEAQTDRGVGGDTSTHRGMRAVSKDDTLVARGANPRTGVVSPYATSESAESGYMTRGRREETAGWREKKTKYGNGMGRSASGKWMQDDQGWSLVGSRAMTPVAQTVGPGLEKRSSVPVEDLQDEFVVNMPSAKEPAPLPLSREQIDVYQRSVERACRGVGGGQALVDPETLPTPRVMTPEGPSTPPRRLEKIRRKEVGSPLSQRKGSTDTVIIRPQARASSMPTPRKDQQRQFRARVISPGSTVLDVSKQSNRHINGIEYQGYPFLGLRLDARSYQMNATPSPSRQTRYTENHRHQLNDLQSRETIDTVTYVLQPPSQSLSQRLPPVNLVHPRQASLPRPKLSGQNLYQSQNVPLPTTISTAITTPTTTTITPPHPCLPRLDGTNRDPQANLPQDHLPHRRLPKVRFQPAPPAAFATSNDSTPGHHQQETAEPSSPARSGMPLSLVAGQPQRPTTEPSQNASTYASGSLPLPYPRQSADGLLDLDPGSELRTRRDQRSASGPAVRETAREPFRPTRGNAHGDMRVRETRTGGMAGSTREGTEVEKGRLQLRSDKSGTGHVNVAEVDSSFPPQTKHAHLPKSDTTANNAVHHGESADSHSSPTTSPPPPSLLTTLHALHATIHLLTQHLPLPFSISLSALATDTYLALLHMNHHVLATLHPSSKAIRVWTSSTSAREGAAGLDEGVAGLDEGAVGLDEGAAGLEEYAVAVADLVLAAVYLLVLGVVVGIVGRVVGWVWGWVVGVWAVGRGVVRVGGWVLGL